MMKNDEWRRWGIAFVTYLTYEQPVAIFPEETIVRKPQYRYDPIRWGGNRSRISETVLKTPFLQSTLGRLNLNVIFCYCAAGLSTIFERLEAVTRDMLRIFSNNYNHVFLMIFQFLAVNHLMYNVPKWSNTL